jgi:DNA helicase HerA-like ATPase
LNDEYGRVSAASIGAIQRGLLTLEEQGADHFFGEPMLDIDDLLQTAPDGRGVVNILAAERLMTSPKLYATFLLWLLAELFENLPEVGDPDKPRMAFFFEEAHLLFSDAPSALLQKIEQVVRLIRSKGVGVYFITQNPDDVPETVLAQLGNRVQHALRAFTPREQRAVRTAAETLRPNPAIDTRAAISELAVGEALVSVLDDRGSPAIVERAWVLPPASRIGPITPDERRAVINGSVIRGHYEQAVDRESAYEKLKNRTEARQADAAPAENAASAPPPAEIPNRRTAPAPAPRPSSGGSITDILLGSTGPRGGRREGILESAARSAARSVGSGVAREIMRGVLGSLLGRRR